MEMRRNWQIHFSSFLTLMDCSTAWWFHMTCLEEAATFSHEGLDSLGTYHLVFSPYFISLFSSSLAALGFLPPPRTLVPMSATGSVSQETTSKRISICTDSFQLSFMKFLERIVFHNSKWPFYNFFCDM